MLDPEMEVVTEWLLYKERRIKERDSIASVSWEKAMTTDRFKKK